MRVLGRRIGELEERMDFDAKSAGFSNVPKSHQASDNHSRLSLSGNDLILSNQNFKGRTKQVFANPSEIMTGEETSK